MKINNYMFTRNAFILIFLMTFMIGLRSQEQNYSEPKLQENQKKNSDDLLKTLSRSKASVWVDTNKGNVYSSSIGSSHLERDKKSDPKSDPSGHSSNMLLTLLLQPSGRTPVSVVQNEGDDLYLKPILLLLQQNQDLMEILLEKQEKLEKSNIQLQNQLKHQHQLIVQLLEQIKMFLEVINSSNIPSAKPPSDEIEKLKQRYSSQYDPHSTSASSSANALVSAAKKKGPDNENSTPFTELAKTTTELDKNLGQTSKQRILDYRAHRKQKPILATSSSETIGNVKRNNKQKSKH